MRTLILSIFLVSLFHSGIGQTKNFIDQPYIEVAGNADTLLTPDEIFIEITISEKDVKGKSTLETLESTMTNRLAAAGVDVERDLKIRDFASNFRYYLLGGKGITRSKIFLLKVSDAEMTGKVFIALEEIGVSNAFISSINHSKEVQIRNELRTRAVENAKLRALALVQPLNQGVGQAIHIVDDEFFGEDDQPKARADALLVNAYGLRHQASREMPEIEFEKIKLAANVKVKFILNSNQR